MFNGHSERNAIDGASATASWGRVRGGRSVSVRAALDATKSVSGSEEYRNENQREAMILLVNESGPGLVKCSL
ncbi:hypothetical protein HFP15_41800 [Amycolatopsis sp. K13G38]|uniref:Uncharacterized protein n=1 Tax=Amycolatopsis acididurans TaxID=2724524 RepID=A0ABX1JHV9_9PSEU|nr:hypothetical protein [Amycolatopsis acididurans]NKQ59387.1 hypothetical protein [Amycolatopsis acididurans]